MRPAIIAVLAVAALAVACGGGDTTPLSGNSEVLSHIPWSAPETANYRLLEGDQEIGTAELSVAANAGAANTLVFSQKFDISKRQITDSVTATADSATLRPSSVARTINGPDGQRTCQATYHDSSVTVDQRSTTDKRTDQINVPTKSYDTWTDLFLWRTLAFAQDFEATYSDVLTCSLAKPDILSVVIKVTGHGSVTVPAGTFQVWTLEIRSGGSTQKAWYADDPAHTLVRYDNGQLVFELEPQ